MKSRGAGSLERSRRNLSTSSRCPNAESEATIQEPEVQIQPPTQDAETVQETAQESHRRFQAEPRVTSRRSTPLSRAPSSRSTMSTSTSESAASSSSSAPSVPQSWPVEPPVTRATLSELDVSKIIHNPKLRHDINYDPELHFRPNLDGEKGRKKQERANQFWRALKKELSEFILDRPTFYANHGENDDWTLPLLLKAVKEIIQTLVPQRDRQFLDEGLNVELLMQQFHKGVADLEKLALWLSQVLKSHCAPMRDDWVDTMYSQLSNGNRNADLDELVTGMRSLLSVLEAMKLDVANHQIRCLRPVLIEDTTHFEQKFFYKKMESGKVDITVAKQWYRDAEQRYAGEHSTHTFGDMGVFFEAMSRLILPSAADQRVPSTFLFDEERILKLRADVLDAINLEICMRMYEDLERVARYNPTSSLLSPKPSMESISSGTFDFNTPPTSSRPSSLVFSSAGSASSSPRSSFVLPSYVAPDHESRAKARNVHSSLVALLQSSPSSGRQSSRWQVIAPSMALQIFRFTNAPMEMLPAFEDKLASSLFRADSTFFQEAERSFHARLISELGSRVREFKGLSGVALFSVATGSRVQNSQSGRERDMETSMRDHFDEGSIEDVATRLAHLGILHWRVWSQLAYAPDLENVPTDDVAMNI
ncbi:Protein SOK1 [Cladobotryum mycophilum]|uniref:Protein SOK1 n=1 Tax=Cladobotryum mycophilum TaxID=491253 RepID=A0ABR0SZF3_9HYPO